MHVWAWLQFGQGALQQFRFLGPMQIGPMQTLFDLCFQNVLDP